VIERQKIFTFCGVETITCISLICSLLLETYSYIVSQLPTNRTMPYKVLLVAVTKGIFS